MKRLEHWQYTCGQRQLKEFLKRPSAKSAWSQNQLRIIMGSLTRHHHLNGHLFRLQLVGNPGVVDANRHMQRPHNFSVTARYRPQ